MNYKEFAIDLRKSDKGQRKRAVKLLRQLGYEVRKRKDDVVSEFNYLSWLNLRNRFEYFESLHGVKCLTLPEDWAEFEAAVTKKLKVGDWVKVLKAYVEPEKVGAVAKVKSIKDGCVYIDGFDHAWLQNAMNKGLLRLATPKEIEEAEAAAKKPVWNYPCHGKHKGSELIVYFSAERDGVVAKKDYGYEVGYESLSWDMRAFTPCDIQIILK